MKRVTCLVAGLMLFAASAAAQAPAAGQKLGLAASMQSAYTTLKGNLTQAAEKMPEANYTFKPASDPDLRTYGQWIGHQTDNQFTNCAIIKGVPNPSPPQSNEKKTRKAELVKALADAFAFCDGAFSALRGCLGHAFARPRVVRHRRCVSAREGHRAAERQPGGRARGTRGPRGAVKRPLGLRTLTLVPS